MEENGILTQLQKRLTGRRPQLMDAAGQYAVLVPLVERAGALHILYEVRASDMRRQPGEVCFPGGRMDSGESPVWCALREAQEELGIAPHEVQVLGQMDFIAHRANFLMHPVLGYLDGAVLEHMELNPAEVGSAFLAPVDYLLSHPPQEYHYTLEPNTPEDFPYELIGIPRNYRWQKGGEEVPVYEFEGHTIWGLTGRITRHLLRHLSSSQ